jgi:hypothetical protein
MLSSASLQGRSYQRILFTKMGLLQTLFLSKYVYVPRSSPAFFALFTVLLPANVHILAPIALTTRYYDKPCGHRQVDICRISYSFGVLRYGSRSPSDFRC